MSCDADVIEEEIVQTVRRRRTTYNTSLVVGIVSITLFLGLFVCEFSRILHFAENVNQPPKEVRSESVGD